MKNNRAEDMILLRLRGHTYDEIARKFGVSSGCVINRVDRQIKRWEAIGFLKKDHGLPQRGKLRARDKR